jgi:hypothetical protein
MLSYVSKPIMQTSVCLSVCPSVCLSVQYICRGEQIAEAINPGQELNCQLTSPLIVTCFLFTCSAAPVQEETIVPVLAETVLPVQDEIRLAAERPIACFLAWAAVPVQAG